MKNFPIVVLSHSLFFSNPHPLFFSSIQRSIRVAASFLPLLILLHSSLSCHHHCKTFPSTLVIKPCNNLVVSLEPLCRISLQRAQTAPSLCREPFTPTTSLHATNTFRTSFSPHHHAGDLAAHRRLCFTHNSTIEGLLELFKIFN